MKLVETPSFKLAIHAKGDENAGKLALVLPGRLDTKDYVHMTSHVDYLADKGFYAISFDPPFTWESPGDIKNYSTTNYIKVVNELIAHYGNKPTLLVGHSRGGAVSQLSSSNPNVKALVLVMSSYGPPTQPDPKNVSDDVFIDHRDLPPGTTRTAKQIEMRTPMNYFRDVTQYNPAEALRKFDGPKLMICGSKDEFIRPEKVKEIFNSLLEPKIFLELDAEHDYRLHADMIKRVNETMGEFLGKYWPSNPDFPKP